jgi:hypothetical protein
MAPALDSSSLGLSSSSPSDASNTKTKRVAVIPKSESRERLRLPSSLNIRELSFLINIEIEQLMIIAQGIADEVRTNV